MTWRKTGLRVGRGQATGGRFQAAEGRLDMPSCVAPLFCREKATAAPIAYEPWLSPGWNLGSMTMSLSVSPSKTPSPCLYELEPSVPVHVTFS